MTLDKRYKILSCLDFGSPLSVEELYSKSKIKSWGTFTYLLEDLAKHQYLCHTNDQKVDLYMYSSKRQYLADRMRSRGKFFLSVVGTLASVFAAVFGLISIFIALS